VTDGSLPVSIGTTDSINIVDLDTTYGIHTYQLVANYTDANGITGTIYSPIQTVTITADNVITAEGIITPGNILTNNSSSFNYQISPQLDTVNSIVINVYEADSNTLVDVLPATNNNLTGTVVANNLRDNTAYYADLTANINGNRTTLSTTTITTLPVILENDTIFANVSSSNVGIENASIQIGLAGDSVNLSKVTGARLQLTPGNDVTLTANQVSQLINGQNITILLSSLNAATDYTVEIIVTGVALDSRSQAMTSFRTLDELDNGLIQPAFISVNFNQTAPGVETVTSN